MVAERYRGRNTYAVRGRRAAHLSQRLALLAALQREQRGVAAGAERCVHHAGQRHHHAQRQGAACGGVGGEGGTAYGSMIWST